MKKIISALLVAVLAVSSILAVIPASADEAKATYNVNWIKQTYSSYSPSGTKGDASVYEGKFDVTKKSDSIASNAKSGAEEYYYISNSQFPLEDGAQYEYTFKVKANGSKYAGVPFAIDGNTPYVIYSNFKDEVRFCKGPRSNEIADTVEPSLTLDSGYAQFKVTFDGLSATIYAKVSGDYKQQAKITLESGSKIVLGVYSREGTGDSQRTATLKNAVLKGMNDAAAKVINAYSSGPAATLKNYVEEIKTKHNEADYTADSYKALKTALDSATKTAAKENLSSDEVESAKAAIDSAVSKLVAATSANPAKLNAMIAEYEKLKEYEIEYTVISFAMVTKAVEDAKELLSKTGVKQSELDAAADVIQGRINELLPSGLKVPRPTTSATDSLESESGSETLANDDGGCRSAVAATAVALGVVAMLGTALVVKKKD